MPVYKVSVKWGKQKFDNVEVDSDEPPVVLKGQLFALSGVPPERQKVMTKGVTLKDDEWGKFQIKDKAVLLMMGSADELPQAPTQPTQFMEDMTDAQLASAFDIPGGLVNLGNTCYMNATVQCLRTIPELRNSLAKLSHGPLDPPVIPSALRDTYTLMDRAVEGFRPMLLLRTLHTAFPQFSEKGENGVFIQQDANECWTQFVRAMQEVINPVTMDSNGQLTETQRSMTGDMGFVDQFLGGRLQSTLKCEEQPEEPETSSEERFLQLSCFISKDVKYMHTGLKNRLQEHITKRSPSLDRDAVYIKTSLIDRLPGYLSVQMVRFFYKEKDNINAKILKDVKFPLSLDVFDMCTRELQQKLTPMRERMRINDENEIEKSKVAKVAGAQAAEESAEGKDEDNEPYWFEGDIGSNNSGFYELRAVLTHQGRSSNSGHYVGWAKRKGTHWFKFDDADVTSVHEDDVLKLSGGGDWHTAYVLLYGPRRLPKGAGLTEKSTESGATEATSTEGAASGETPMET
ncbi:ubiquitin carboxyl-terminal hydrolase 14-like [Sycon ciliatum]|uniref:ubiquitin carboxyl-terminal hydrolase 14-like n=1 Tax=Sycon ciliatum TaxID=27933 RepID=UPI0031F66CC1|eukprot:scpid5738/ scgid22585/ Ubiquitin carboxyl-terminal hydrolase 14; Deubiquitinating enzyme 14; Ubiquitin thioesterase 14; Ubiquitin-specific-processing protease 14